MFSLVVQIPPSYKYGPSPPWRCSPYGKDAWMFSSSCPSVSLTAWLPRHSWSASWLTAPSVVFFFNQDFFKRLFGRSVSGCSDSHDDPWPELVLPWSRNQRQHGQRAASNIKLEENRRRGGSSGSRRLLCSHIFTVQLYWHSLSSSCFPLVSISSSALISVLRTDCGPGPGSWPELND